MNDDLARLVSFETASAKSYGLLTDRGIIDLGTRFGSSWPTLHHVIVDGALLRLIDMAAGLPADLAERDVRLRIPLPDTGKIICVGRNYPGRNADDPVTFEVPSLFVRFPHSLAAHGEPIVVPPESEQLDYEGELAIVIGRAGRRIAEEDVLDHIAALTLCNEGYINDWLHKARFNITQGKNFDKSGGMGPWIVPFTNPGQIEDIALRTFVNGELRQSDRTGRMLFSVPRLIAYISTFATLLPGDIISTGSPMGKGVQFDPPRWLRPGDVVVIEADGIGRLSNPVRAEAGVSG